MTRVVNFLAGFIIGLVLGGVVAVLLAPQSGPEIRGRFRSRMELVLEEARRAAEATRADAHARLADLKARQS
jgi:gas vesicle protein